MAQRQLNIRSDEAADTAGRLAKQLGKTTTEVVIEALRVFEAKAAQRDELGFTPEQRQRFDSLRGLSRRAREHLLPDAPSNHDWLYDESGLPK